MKKALIRMTRFWLSKTFEAWKEKHANKLPHILLRQKSIAVMARGKLKRAFKVWKGELESSNRTREQRFREDYV
eukprot:CAMPEP_0198207022 /NCGR_PEP_ID=MMETSP1445-20131203/10513_1 /TAXON_ID=36898 /ORGANISM="Pyramimonas sp., Strain CCMP2087" /LENGTH=73 /DNA_ID=CAMNT_0043879905 /DNA_START=47 /DNA_END=264 /DNA_ORIENTATION=+